MKKLKIINGVFAVCLIFCFSFTCFSINKTAIVNSNNAYEKKSNKKIAWGIKRVKDHKQPDVGKNNKEIIDAYKGMALGNPDSKNIYLTFDAGYEAGYTAKILDALKENNVKAIFFVTGHYVNSEPEMIKRMIDEGHLIGNHTVNHKVMTDIDNNVIKDEVMNLHKTVFDKFGYEMKYFRPPKGEFSERTIDYTNSLGYTSVMWSVAYDDWDEKKQGREDYAKEKILDNLHNGAIILLHSNSKDNANVLDFVIKEAKKMGYEFKSLDEFER